MLSAPCVLLSIMVVLGLLEDVMGETVVSVVGAVVEGEQGLEEEPQVVVDLVWEQEVLVELKLATL